MKSTGNHRIPIVEDGLWGKHFHAIMSSYENDIDVLRRGNFMENIDVLYFRSHTFGNFVNENKCNHTIAAITDFENVCTLYFYSVPIMTFLFMKFLFCKYCLFAKQCIGSLLHKLIWKWNTETKLKFAAHSMVYIGYCGSVHSTCTVATLTPVTNWWTMI